MQKYLTYLLIMITALAVPAFAEQEQTQEQAEIKFTPPTGWRFTENSGLPKSVKIMVVGQGKHEFPPSMNLGTEHYDGTLKDYLKIIKNINATRHADWKDLGTIHTEAGNASLSQVDMHTEWGDVRMMHVILAHEGTIYILTAAALKDEFPAYYKDFFKAMTSLKISDKKI